ncbi:ring canal kelch protein-like [Acyrthosiphon pisum]|uniref:BTB domain-containing protein n=1 Tax=Acyrthosiphon pisum TaxID=7029 RepID=A0A8R2D327_ACYPI|nr:ring canal kelch protein-like [Acyrthosiphon pisum]|eukprot:XP_016659117.1 PREDICTED: ring canal kelch protein-like [Acyrthosiphon pisum]
MPRISGQKEEVLCDIKLETDNGVLVCAHKEVLVTASPYFRAMFTSFAEGDKGVVNLRELDCNCWWIIFILVKLWSLYKT